MNLRLISKMLGIVALLMAGTMLFSLPWAFSALGRRTYERAAEVRPFETRGFVALLASMVICLIVAIVFWWLANNENGALYRKEAMAVVGLSWVLATVLGALPYCLAGVKYRSAIRVFEPTGGEHHAVQIRGDNYRPLDDDTYAIFSALLDAGAIGLDADAFAEASDTPNAAEKLSALVEEDEEFRSVILLPGDEEGPNDRRDHYRIRWQRMGVLASLFEAQSGFSTTGATVICDLEDPHLVPHCILFWRSSTHFLGGLGIIVLFVAILGQGSAGKALMRAEMPGPSKEGSQTRMQHTAWTFTVVYCALNGVQAALLLLAGMTPFDALCHAFGTMATGGFSTYNASVGAFDSPLVDSIIVVFMLLAGTNFTLLYFLVIFQPQRMTADIEWRTYVGIIAGASAAIIVFGMWNGDKGFGGLGESIRYGVFQVISIMTTTGFCTADFNTWNSFARGTLFVLMFVGGCAGSTGGGLKVIRHILFVKILRQELEHSFHPSVVRPLQIAGNTVEDPNLRLNILVYFGIISVLFATSWLFVLTIEPDATWGSSPEHVEHKLIDSASAVSATLNNIGPGLGIVGATQNYAQFSGVTYLLFTVLMMIGRLEIFVIVVLFMPSFWRAR
jgi:trk system potassium uptake protein TrkH